MRIGIVGTNFISDRFVEASREVEGLEVTVISSRSLPKAKAFAERHGIPHAVEGVKELAESGWADAVYLPVPNSVHRELSLYFLEKGYHVLCEKPFAVNRREAEQMFECAKRNGRYIADAIYPLYTPNFRQLKKSLPRAGTIHRADFFFCQYSSRWQRWLNGERPDTFLKDHANGTLMVLGIYPMALAVALFGKPQRIQAAAQMMETGTDLSTTAILEYPDKLATVNVCHAADGVNVTEILGENGSLCTYSGTLKDLWMIDRRTKERIDLNANEKNPMSYELQDFADRASAGERESALVPHALTLSILEAMDAARERIGLKFPTEE